MDRSDSQTMRPLTGFVVLFLVLVVGIVIALTVLNPTTPNAHTITGVPYESIYHGTEIRSSTQFAIYTLLRYWGDDRFTPADIATALPAEQSDVPIMAQVDGFLTEHDYITEVITVNDLSDIYPYVAQNIPVILPLRVTKGAPKLANGLSVVVGYSTEDDTITVHDNLYGNNHVWTRTDVEALRLGTENKALVVEPLLATGNMGGPDPTRPDIPRFSIMDNPGVPKIMATWAIIDAVLRDGRESDIPTYAERARLLEQILEDPAFAVLHPADRLAYSMRLAQLYSNRLERYEDAITLLDHVIFPLTEHDLSAPHGEWARPYPERYDEQYWTTKPWILFGVSHHRLKNIEEARAAYQIALTLNPNDEEAAGFLSLLPKP